MEHDALSKLFFALPPVQADVLRIVAQGWVHLLDLGTLERVSAEHADPLDGLPDAAARALAPLQPGGWVLLDAAARALEDWPTGNRVTAWVRLLRAGTAAALDAALGEGLADFPGSEDVEVRKAFRLWALALLRARAWDGDGLSAFEDEQGENEMTTLLEANGRKIRADIFEQGVAQGEARARADQRAQLRRLAGRKFGGRAAERLSTLIEDVADPERLAEVGDWIIDCGTETELLARAGRRA